MKKRNIQEEKIRRERKEKESDQKTMKKNWNEVKK